MLIRNNYFFTAFAMVALTVVFGATVALAQAPAAAPELNAIGSLSLDVLTWVGTAAIATVTGFLSNWLRKMTIFQRNQSESLSNDRLSSIIYKGIDYAMVAQQNEAAKKGTAQNAVKIDNFFLGLVTGFVKTNAPELLQYFGLEPDQAKLSPRLNTMILARLPQYIGSPLLDGGVSTSAEVAGGQRGATDHFSLPIAPVPVTTANASGG